MDKTLIERLREVSDNRYKLGPLHLEAADEIEHLGGENERLNKIVGPVVDVADEVNGKEWPVYEIQAKVARLAAIVEKLPKTADDVVLLTLTGQKLWRLWSNTDYEPAESLEGYNPVMAPVFQHPTCGRFWHYASMCYSTRAAAQAAASYNEPDIMDKAKADAAASEKANNNN